LPFAAIMDMLAFLQDSTDDDSDGGKASDLETTKTKTKKPIHPSTAIACASTIRQSKVRRRGSIDVISSSKAQDSNIFSRSIPHRRGHWAGHVKIPLLTKASSSPSSFTDDDDLLRTRKNNNVKTFRDLLERRGISGTMVEHDYLHLSLSKQFSLQASHIEPFVRQLTNLVRQEHPTSLRVESMSASELRSIWETGSINEIVLLNEEKTRSFLCWKVHPNVTLQRIVAHVDNVMKNYNQPVYYEPATFHISIASFPGNIFEKLDADDDDVANNNIRYFGTHNDDDQFNFQVPNKSAYGSSVITRPLQSGGCAHEEIEEDSSSSSSLDEIFLVPVHELKCTVGTTKEFAIALRSSHEL
jgi:hypothetical protein